MKSTSLFILITFLALASCSGKKATVSVETKAEQITTSDSNAIVAAPDSLDSSSLDPQTNETALQQDPPRRTEKVCDPSFTLLGKPAGNLHIYYVTGFNQDEFKCWNLLEEHGSRICGENICKVYYVEKGDVVLTKSPPDYIDAAVLKSHGLARFEHDGDFWTIQGGKVWKRSGKNMAYYNTNNHLGG